jgi:hypothetical protein
VDTIRHGLLYIEKALVFKHEGFILSAHDRSRIQATVDKLVNDRVLSRALTRSREPAGAVVVQRLITTLPRDAIEKGTSNWCGTLLEVALILLVSCLQCRSGDILGEAKDVRADLPGLRYSDIELVLRNGSAICNIEARIKIRSAKGME